MSSNLAHTVPDGGDDRSTDPVSTAAAESAVREIVQSVERREAAIAAADGRAKRDWKPVVYAVVVVACLSAWFVPIDPPAEDPLAGASPADRVRGMQVGLEMQARIIQSYVTLHRRLPADLSEVTVLIDEVRYERIDDQHFRLRLEQGGVLASYDSQSANSGSVAADRGPFARGGAR